MKQSMYYETLIMVCFSNVRFSAVIQYIIAGFTEKGF